MTIRLRVISLGAGVQSSTLALMAAHGEISPIPDAAIFADTQSEPAAVYRHLEWLESVLPFPVYRVSTGSLRQSILSAMAGHSRMDARPPFHTARGGMLNRQCTADYKIDPIQRKIRELIGLLPRQRGPKTPAVEQWIGISLDEVIRARPARKRYVVNRWPLIEARMSRHDCLRWCERHGYPTPPKSACTFCPYHSDAQWRALRDDDPESFADAVAIDQAIRNGIGPRLPNGGGWFVHRSCVPLADVDLSTLADHGQLDLFGNECEGMCGV